MLEQTILVPLYILELRFSAALALSALYCNVRDVLRYPRLLLLALYYCQRFARFFCKGRFSASLLTRSGVKRPLCILELRFSAIGKAPMFFSLVADAQRG